jgi:cytochrome b
MKSSATLDASRHVWDLFVRIFHWTLVVCVLMNSFVLDDGETVHQWAGYLASALVLARVVWGFVGSRHARFTDFFPTPGRIVRHVRGMFSGHAEFHWGHNPLGALMMMALMGMVLALGVTGWMQGLDAYWGEEWLQDLHEVIGDALIILVGLHAASALIMGRIERTRLLKAMVTGVKERY